VTFVSYAQNFEDVLLWRALHDVNDGRYLDIGAHDPFIDSVSLAFYQAGWRGVNVEPIPYYAARLREARPNDEVIEAAVDDKPGPIPFYELSGLSSGCKGVAEHHARAGHRSREILVPTVRLEHLLNLSKGELHWLKIDVEGMEQRVLKSWGDCPKRPWILVVEATFPNTQQPTDHLWIEEVLGRGYSKAHFDGLSCYFVHQEHQELAARLAAPANVFDAFSITPKHFSAKPLREEMEMLSERLEKEQRQGQELNSALGQTHQKLDLARQEQNRAIERLVTAENEHRQALYAAIEAGREPERRATEAEAVANRAQVDLARFEERSAQLQDKLDRASQVAGLMEERAKRLESEVRRADEAANSARERLTEAKREISELGSTLIRAETERDDARAAVENLTADLSGRMEQVGVLIRAVAAERSGRWHRIGEALGLAGKDLHWRALSSWSMEAANRPEQWPIAHGPTTSESKTTMNSRASTEVRNPFLRANSLDELLSWNDVDFVRCAYVTVLGRQPDAEGEAYYTDRVRRGHSKLDVLWQLRRSPEGPKHDPGIAGLDRALRRARARSWPIRAMRRAIGKTSPSASSVSASTSAAPLIPAISHNVRDPKEASASAQASPAEIEALKLLLDGFGHALRGVASAQARHEEQIDKLLSSTASPSRPLARRRSSSK
jgi:FkbM family methyltransferase